MPCIAFAYCICKGLNIPVLAGMALGWIGDIILIKANDYLCRVFGATSFAAGHFLYFYALMETFREEDSYLWMFFALSVCAGIAIFVYTRIGKKIEKSMRLSCFAYMFLLGIMTGIGFCRAVLDLSLGTYLGLFSFFGYVLFLCSDSILINQWFTVKDPHPSTDFKVMITYTLAQLCLCIGFLR